jgi:hypothetical protein
LAVQVEGEERVVEAHREIGKGEVVLGRIRQALEMVA